MIQTFFRRCMALVTLLAAASCSEGEGIEAKAQAPASMGKTLVVYYSFTNNVRTIVGEMTKQVSADVVEVQPAEEGLDYAANNYEIGSSLIAAIRNHPEDAESYPSIKPVDIDFQKYDNIIVCTPLWWSQMAAPMQSFLFQNGQKMAGKHVALIVSSASSGISSTVADAKRLIPEAVWTGDALWINDRKRSQTPTLLAEWLASQTFQTVTETMKMNITIDGQTQSVTLESNQAARELHEKLQEGPVTVTLNTSGGFEIWGALGFSLTSSDERITAGPGDVILYDDSNICLLYGSNTWSYTRLGKIDGLDESQLRSFLKAGERNIVAVLSLTSDATALNDLKVAKDSKDLIFNMKGQQVEQTPKGIYVTKGKKVAYNK
ncbi:MAG: hypothetical protein IJ148_04145 [Bacteroidaceae bacterium]|nr:hypothetical protein [Bacteroidaceae bacterium]